MKVRSLFNILDNLKIKYKLFLAYFLVTVIPVTGIGYFSYSNSKSFLINQSINTITQLQQNTISDINKRLENYLFLANTVFDNRRIQYYVSDNSQEYYDEYEFVIGFMEPILQSLLNATGHGIYLALIRYSDVKGEYIQNNFEGYLSKDQPEYNYLELGARFFQVINFKSVKDRQWFKDLKDNTDNYLWLQVGSDKSYNNVSLVREMVSYDDMSEKKCGLLRLTVRVEDIFGSEEDPYNSQNGFNLIFDKYDNLLSVESAKKSFYEDYKKSIVDCLKLADKDTTLVTSDKIFIKGYISSGNFKIISVFPITQLTEGTNKIRNMTVLYCIISLIILLGITFFISASFSNRIIKISKQMEKFKKGDFNAKVKGVKNDEIGFLASVFNDMGEKLSVLIKDNYQANIDKKDAQLKALQAQINPHILYNSLSTIGRLAEIGENKSIISMVMSLTKFYRITLSKGKDIISIQDEVDHVRSYIEVFKIRKGEYFDVVYNIDDNVLQYYTVKVILQPFIENIFEHGLRESDNPVTIIISVIEDRNDILFKIIDNGIGIKKERLYNLFSENEKNKESGYGIKNVDDRVKLQFGSKYGIIIDSIYGAGTTITIRIPRFRP